MRPVQISACILLLSWQSGAIAATLTRCVHNATELQNYLNAASSGSNSNDYVLQLRDGLYLAPSGGFFYNQNTNHSLDMEGGFFGLNGGNGCDLRILSAAGTQLDGRGNQTVFSVISNGATSGNITLRYLTFQNAGGDVSAVDVTMLSNTGALRIDNTLITGNVTKYDTVHLNVQAGKIYLIDNAVVDNVYAANLSQVVVHLYVGTSQNVLAYVNNNTIAGNTESNGFPALTGLSLYGSAGFDLANNIVWNDGYCDVSAYGNPPPAVTFDKDDIDGYCAVAPQAGSGDINEDPLFVDPALGNYRLQPASPAVNAGDNSPPGTTRTVDLDGKPRVVGIVDMGAYELPDFIFADGFGP